MRITFSRSLAEHVVKMANQGEVQVFDAVAGRSLQKNEKSASQLYAIISSKSGKILRIATSQEEAGILCDYDSRKVAEAWIRRKS